MLSKEFIQVRFHTPCVFFIVWLIEVFSTIKTSLRKVNENPMVRKKPVGNKPFEGIYVSALDHIQRLKLNLVTEKSILLSVRVLRVLLLRLWKSKAIIALQTKGRKVGDIECAINQQLL